MAEELNDEHTERPGMQHLFRWLPLLVLILAVLGGWMYWRHQRAEEQRQQELIDEGFTLARVLSSTFSKASALKVGSLSGKVEITTRDAGWLELFPSSQTVRLPWSVDYTVDVSQLDLEDYRWDPESRTLIVRLPPVTESEPNIDESRVEVRDRDGIWISRSAQEKLNRYASRGAIRTVEKEASTPARKAQAEANAEAVVANLLRTPLEVAGLSGVKVVALGSADSTANRTTRERWDVSRSIEEVLSERAGR